MTILTVQLMSILDGCLKVEESKYIQNVNMLPLFFRKKKIATLLKNMDLVGVKVCESAVIHLWKNMLHWSMLLSDHTLYVFCTGRV